MRRSSRYSAAGVSFIGTLLALAGCSPRDSGLPYQDPKLSVEKRTEDLLRRMTAEEKQKFLSGSGTDTTQAIWRLSVPALHSLAFSRNATAMAAAWDPDLVGREARAAAAEALASNHRQIVGPDPAAFSTDPWLASRMAVAWVSGLQGDGVIATLTGFGRGYGTLDETTLNEVSLFPYEAAVEEAGLWAVRPAVEDPPLTGVLEDGWGFRGFVLGSPDSVGGLDDQVRRRLRAMFAIGMFDEETPASAAQQGNPDESIVLLRNEHDLLPLRSDVRSIAVIGAQSLAIPADSRANVSYAPAAGAVELARKSEVAVVFGADPALIRAVASANSKTVAVLDKPVATDASAILVAWGRRDIGPVLFGQVNPSGRLPVAVLPQFPFGSGLSYTTFRYDDLRIFPKTPRYGQLVQVVLNVTNIGGRAGADVVQVCVRDKLKAFRRVELRPGESRTVSFELDRRAMSFYDPLVKTWATEPGVFDVSVGALRGSFELFR